MKLRKKSKFQIIFIALVVLISFKIYTGYRSDISYFNDRKEDLKEKIEEQKQYSEQLDKEQDIYASQERVEKIARETLGLVKSDEKFFKNYNDNH